LGRAAGKKVRGSGASETFSLIERPGNINIKRF